MIFMTVVGALVLTGVAVYAILGSLGLWWFVMVGGMEWSLGAFAYCLFWSVVAAAITLLWWFVVGTHITIGFA